jgi:hypothetical protein
LSIVGRGTAPFFEVSPSLRTAQLCYPIRSSNFGRSCLQGAVNKIIKYPIRSALQKCQDEALVTSPTKNRHQNFQEARGMLPSLVCIAIACASTSSSAPSVANNIVEVKAASVACESWDFFVDNLQANVTVNAFPAENAASVRCVVSLTSHLHDACSSRLHLRSMIGCMKPMPPKPC